MRENLPSVLLLAYNIPESICLKLKKPQFSDLNKLCNMKSNWLIVILFQHLVFTLTLRISYCSVSLYKSPQPIFVNPMSTNVIRIWLFLGYFSCPHLELSALKQKAFQIMATTERMHQPRAAPSRFNFLRFSTSYPLFTVSLSSHNYLKRPLETFFLGQ